MEKTTFMNHETYEWLKFWNILLIHKEKQNMEEYC